jgi:NAD+ synthase
MAVVGVSGGVDSAVVLHLCVRAVGKERVIPVSLPCGSGSAKDWGYACHLLSSLGWVFKNPSRDLETVDIFEAYVRLATCVEARRDRDSYPSWNPMHRVPLSQISLANLQARLRMCVLYAIAGDNNGIVMGTTNRSEYEIGYATKYGDHGVDVEPIQEFFKSEVFEMAKLLGVPQEIIDRPPSAGLWDGQTDEGEIGMSYTELDLRLRDWAKGIVPQTREEADRWMPIWERMQKNEHKKNLPPSYKR